MSEKLVRGTQNLLIAVGHRSIPIPSRIFAYSRLFLFFLIALSIAAFYRVFASVKRRKTPLSNSQSVKVTKNVIDF